MRDLNFFEPYIDKKQFKFNKMILLYVLLVIVVMGVGVFGIMNQIKINALQKQVNSLRQVAEDPSTVARVREIEEFSNETDQFSREVQNIRVLDKSIQARDVIGDSILEQINEKLPEKTFIVNINISGRSIRISGFGEDRYSIAEFAKGLEELPLSAGVFVSNITAIESYYSFNLDLELQEVMVNVN